MKRFEKAAIGEGMQSCDICGAIGRVGEIISIYHEGRGQKVDYCPRCFEREVVRKRD